MHSYIHKVHYYETDKMGISHHSNYIRWMEEARMDLLKSIDFDMRKVEESGIMIPVVSIEANYKQTTSYDDEIRVDTWTEKYNGVKLHVGYKMTNIATGAVVFTGKSSHCFINEKGTPVSCKKALPVFHELMLATVEEDK